MGAVAPRPAADGERFEYPPAVTRAALVRAGAGLFITLGPLSAVRPTPAAIAILGVLAAIFAVYGALAVIRMRSAVAISEQGLRVIGPISADIRWDALIRVKLRYYTTKRDRAGGWMVLTLKEPGRAVRIESTLAGFASLLARVVAEAHARGAAIPAATRFNLQPFGIDPDAWPTQGVA